VTVGAYCSIAEDVTFFIGGNHRSDWLSTFPFPGVIGRGHPASRGPIVVGNDVWIGMGAAVLSGVQVGDGAVVGAFAVVTRDIPPYAVVAGNPARVIRYRFPPETVATLLTIRWWEWSDDDVAACIPILTGGSLAELVEMARGRS
jgi:acetyltransferase-like isoleucine patch superfamily enzyme